jgi:hypothetical protein
MPYVSKMAQERARWMTLREAVAHIATADHCSFRAAWLQLRTAIGDQEVSVRWAGVRVENHTSDGDQYFAEDLGPPMTKRFWESARAVFIGPGCVLDDPACQSQRIRRKLIREGTLRYRGLLVLREHVEKIWPGGSAEHLASRESVSASNDIGARGRPSAHDSVWQTLDRMRNGGANLGLSQKRLAELVAQDNDKKLDHDMGWSERTIVQHVSDWLKEQGLTPTGNAKKPK